ncbi:MAG: hypothetical protein V1936_02280 [Patescibacteria group bacterium]
MYKDIPVELENSREAQVFWRLSRRICEKILAANCNVDGDLLQATAEIDRLILLFAKGLVTAEVVSEQIRFVREKIAALGIRLAA